ncbi:uncharacterized protein LOC117316360 [Pecten maximus]|uniref:uncharacterized protein LOC117316360 n=1 Tax=Pecten maximus TaxID=6579 RepID=UPI0014581D35|nr:uncharacterized protein LOC117316360 [Pecten maximus]
MQERKCVQLQKKNKSFNWCEFYVLALMKVADQMAKGPRAQAMFNCLLKYGDLGIPIHPSWETRETQDPSNGGFHAGATASPVYQQAGDLEEVCYTGSSLSVDF